MMLLYRLVGRIAVPCDDLQAWAKEFEDSAKRRVAESEIHGLRISTVFLAIDHNFFGDGDPLLFETMIFGPEDFCGQYQRRCATWDEAERMHAAAEVVAASWIADVAATLRGIMPEQE